MEVKKSWQLETDLDASEAFNYSNKNRNLASTTGLAFNLGFIIKPNPAGFMRAGFWGFMGFIGFYKSESLSL